MPYGRSSRYHSFKKKQCLFHGFNPHSTMARSHNTWNRAEALGGQIVISSFFFFTFRFLFFTFPFLFFTFQFFVLNVLIFTSSFWFSIEISVFILFFSVFVFNVLIFTSSFCFLVLVLILIAVSKFSFAQLCC